jgi:hypothetical protein
MLTIIGANGVTPGRIVVARIFVIAWISRV